MRDVKTVDRLPATTIDPLRAKQREDVAKMRTSLLCCSDDAYSKQVVFRNISVMSAYHQYMRIIQYLDKMDRIEERMYEAIDFRVENIDITNTSAWSILLGLQERLQKLMIDSYKLIEPYINIPNLFIEEVPSIQNNSDGTSILSKTSRDKLRTSAQQVLDIIGPVIEVDGTDGDIS